MRNKQKYSPTEAIEAVEGLHRKKLYKMMKDREIAYEQGDTGRVIDVNELIRVFGDAFQLPAESETSETDETPQRNTLKQNETREKHSGNTGLHDEITLLRERIADKDAAIKDKDQIIQDLRMDRDEWRSQAQRLLLTDQRQAPETPPAPVQTQHESEEGHTTVEPSNTSQNAILVKVAAMMLVTLALTIGMNVYSDTINQWLEMWMGTREGGSVTENTSRETQGKQPETQKETPTETVPLQSFPPLSDDGMTDETSGAAPLSDSDR